MSKKSWVATTGLCVLMATSAAQAHLIPICVEAYESGTEVSGAVDGVTRSHVTFTRAGDQSGAVPAVGTKSAWQKAKGKAAPYWSASSGPIGNCLLPDLSYSHARGQERQVPEGPDAGVRLAPAVAVLMDASVDSATEFSQFDQAHSPWGWSSDGAGNGANSFNRVLGQQSSAAGNSSLVPLQTSNRTFGPQAGRPNSTAGNNNGNIGRTPAGGKDGHAVVDGISDDAQATQVPEPETLALLMVGLLGVAVTSRRRRKPAATG